MSLDQALRAQDWKKIHAQLLLFTHHRLRKRSWELAEEVTQDAIGDAFEHRGGWDPEKEPMLDYLKKVVLNRTANENKRRRYTSDVVLDEDRLDAWPPRLQTKSAAPKAMATKEHPMATTKRNGKALLKAIHDQKIEDDWNKVTSMSDAELDSEIRAAGGDPEKVRADGEKLIADLFARRDRLAWQKGAAASLASVAKKAEARRAAPRLPRAELVTRLDAARKDPRFSSAVAMMFQKKPLEESSDEELQSLLDDIELLDDEK